MERLSIPSDTGEGHYLPAETLQKTEEGYTGEAAERLAAFENYYESLAAAQPKLAEELETLRAAGKKNSTRFKELLGKKMMESNILLTLQIYGVK